MVSLLLCGAAAAAVALEHGFRRAPLPLPILRVVQFALPWVALCVRGDVAWRALSRHRWKNSFGAVGEPLVALSLVAEAAGLPGCGETLAVAAVVATAIRLNGSLARSMKNPSLLFPISFLVLIAVSTMLLRLPAATPEGNPIGWVDAAFTATSAACVTGLAVRDTALEFTLFGQAVIAGTIQVGGLGVMIFGSTLALLFGARMSFKENVTLSMALDEYPAHRITRFVWFIVLVTFCLELIGAAILYLSWPADALGGSGRLWCSVFHSVSAFCNAGFDITGESLIGVRSGAAAYIGIMPMIVLGGLGFIVLDDVWRALRGRLGLRRERTRLSTHSKLVLATTALLLLGGFVIILVSQATESGRLSWQHVLDAAFMSTTARTAGFTTVPMGEFTPGSRFTLMVLVSISRIGNPL